VKYEDLIGGKLGAGWTVIKGYASHVPIFQLLLGIVIAFVLIYLIQKKLQSLFILGIAEGILYYNIRDNLQLLTDKTIETGGWLTWLGKFHIFLYMNKALSMVSVLPDSPEKQDIVIPVMISFLLLVAYFVYIFYDHMDKKGKGEYAPVMALLLSLAFFGGGVGIIRYLQMTSVERLWGISMFSLCMIIITIYVLIVYYMDFWEPSRKRTTRGRQDREMEDRQRRDGFVERELDRAGERFGKKWKPRKHRR